MKDAYYSCNIILGSNTDAKIYHLFNPNFKMIKHADLDDHTFKVTPTTQSILDTVVLFAANEHNANLLSALGLDPSGVKVEKILITSAEAGISKEEIIQHKLTDQNTGECLGVHPIYGANKKIKICKQDSDYMLAYDISVVKIRSMLKDKMTEESYIDINHLGSILEITNCAIYCEAGTLHFNKAISTINARKMQEFCPNSFSGLKGLPSTLFLFDRSADDSPNWITYNHKGQWNRMNAIHDKMVVDVTGGISPEVFALCCGSAFDFQAYLTHITIPDGKILKHSFHNLPPSIEPLGRFAEWNPDHRLEDTVMRATMGSLHELWQQQKLLNQSIVGVPFDLAAKQSQTKDYLLHLIYQSTQLLDKVNWKMHKSDITLEYDKIVSEVTDVFKYWLSIANVWEISPMDLIKENAKKTKKASEKYGNRKNGSS